MEPIDTLVCARFVAPVRTGAVLERHAVAIAGGRIVAVLPEAEARARYAPRERIDRPEHLLTPGLVNARVPCPSVAFRGLGEGLPRDAWRARLDAAERAAAAPDALREATLLAVAELLAAGVTCVGDASAHPDVVASVAVDVGLRAVVSLPIAERPTAWAADADEHFHRGLRLHDEYRDHPLVSAAFTVPAVADVGDATLARLKVLVDQLEAPLVVDLHETAAAITRCRRTHGEAPFARLERLGLANALLVGVHGTHLAPAEIAAAGRAHARIVHCPTADLRLGAGIAPVPALLAAGIEVALGSGPAAVTNDLDLLHEARLAALLAAGGTGDPATLSPARALRMATLGGAAALGLDDETGSLEDGKRADLACFDLGRLPTAAVADPVAALVHAGGRDLVADVWVGGRRLLADGVLPRRDVADLATRAAALRRPAVAVPPRGATQ